MNEPSPLPFTGERFTPECVREIRYEHWHRYAFAARMVSGAVVLDCACGEGYGSAMLAAAAERVIGVDVDADAIAHAQQRYARSNLQFQTGNALALPLDDASVDYVVSFETLEHLREHDELLSEFRRVLRPDGVLLLSCPDKHTYSDLPGHHNPYHLRELYRPEFEDLLTRHFSNWRMYGQKLMFQSALWALDGPGRGLWCDLQDEHSNVSSDRPEFPALYFLAVASANPARLEDLPLLSLWADREESVYSHYNQEVGKNMKAGERIQELEQQVAELEQRLQQQTSSVDQPAPWRRWFGR